MPSDVNAPECRAKFCVLPATAEHTRPDNGEPLWLCEQHGDDLALGFELKGCDMERPDRLAVATAAIETYWLEGMGGNEDLAEWWGTQDCHDTAEALAEAVLAALDPVENPDD